MSDDMTPVLPTAGDLRRLYEGVRAVEDLDRNKHGNGHDPAMRNRRALPSHDTPAQTTCLEVIGTPSADPGLGFWPCSVMVVGGVDTDADTGAVKLRFGYAEAGFCYLAAWVEQKVFDPATGQVESRTMAIPDPRVGRRYVARDPVWMIAYPAIGIELPVYLPEGEVYSLLPE